MKDYTEIAKRLLLDEYNKSSLSEALGISRPTLNTRLQKGNWKKGEKKMLDGLITIDT